MLSANVALFLKRFDNTQTTLKQLSKSHALFLGEAVKVFLETFLDVHSQAYFRHSRFPPCCSGNNIPHLHPQHNRDYNRSFVGFFEEEAGDGVGDVVFYQVEVDGVLFSCLIFDSFFDDDARLLEELLALAQIDKAAADDVRRLAQAAGLGVDGGDDDKHAFLREHGAVADNHLLQVADGEAVYQPEAVGRRLLEPHNFCAFILYLDDRAVVGDDYLVLRAAARLGDVGMDAEHVVVAVHRHKVPRVYLLVDPKGFVAVGVARGVHIHGVAVDDARALPAEVVVVLMAAALAARPHRWGAPASVPFFTFAKVVILATGAQGDEFA